MTDTDHERAEGSTGPAAPDERTVPITERREHDDRERLTRRTESEAGADGFVWCETASTPDPADGGFEWCEPAGDETRASTDSAGSGPDPETEPETGIELEIDPETEPETDAEGERYSLPRELVTTTRLTGSDDEAVALLSALRRDPDGGRWRRAATELGDE